MVVEAEKASGHLGRPFLFKTLEALNFQAEMINM
jgi:hypothetical protein